MNWGAVLFFCARLCRVCAGRRVKTGVFRSDTPVFGRKPPIFPSRLPIFCARRGSVRCAVRSDAQFLAHRVKEVSKRLANWGGWRVEAAGG